MKKIFSFVVLFAAVAMVGCAGNSNKKNAAADEKACCEKCEKCESCCEGCKAAAEEAAEEAPAETAAAETPAAE